MISSIVPSPITLVRAALVVTVSWGLVACAPDVAPPQACTDGERVLNVGFYAFFVPVSQSADEDPASTGFNTHLGYEADLLTGLEAMEGAGLSFARRGIAAWDGIWLLSAKPEYDLISGGITILDSRTRDATGNELVTFTSGHITFRQSILARAEDAERLASYDALTGGVRVGALAGTTGEARFLELMGLVDSDGVLMAGVRVDTPQGAAVADGSEDYFIRAAGASPNLDGRRNLQLPGGSKPEVVYLGDELGDPELLQALRDGKIDALARGEIGNLDAVYNAHSSASFVITALDDEVEQGGFTLAATEQELASCLDEKISWLTDNRRIGHAEWLANTSVFQERARLWNERAP